jgi:hypothetical protein
MKILTERAHRSSTSSTHSYKWADDPSAGFSFPIGEDGELIPPANPDAARSRATVEAGVKDGTIIDNGVQSFTNHWHEPATGQCDCGRKVHLHHPLDNDCDCGRCYNGGGQEVTPSSQCDSQGNPFDGY